MTTALRRLARAPAGNAPVRKADRWRGSGGTGRFPRLLARTVGRVVLGAYVPARTMAWPPASRLFVVGDELGWSIDDDAARLAATARRLGCEVAPAAWARYAREQAVFSHDHFGALRPRWLESTHRLGLSYFHGRPGTPGYPEFADVYERLQRHAHRVDRVQVTHGEMRDLVASAGVDEAKIFQIPIGVELEWFPLGDAHARANARLELGLPGTAFVVGSFQKDGVGRGAGLQPKEIKGPDAFVATLARVREAIPELVVLLTGPARGYVRGELERLGIPHVHLLLGSPTELAVAYHALDVYLVTSRQEGGPKAIFEAAAAGVPLVTTRVGQAQELLTDGEDALLAEVDDVDALAAAVRRVYEDVTLVDRLRSGGRVTAEAYSDERLDARWRRLLDGFVRRAG
jgi:glycosyltransferase involved in cell wall biosynthesis